MFINSYKNITLKLPDKRKSAAFRGKRRKLSVTFRLRWPVSWVFPLPFCYNDPKICTGGQAMQCQKLKTYMETGRVIFLPARTIQLNPEQPRQVFREAALQELADSIAQHGILQPLSVRRVGNSYQLIAGERRLRAAQMVGLTEIPCIVMTMDQHQSAVAAMVENLQRQDLDFIEEARGIARLMELGHLGQEQAAAMLGRSQSSIANKLRLLRHSEGVLEALRRAELTERHARALLRLGSEDLKMQAIAEIARQKMNVARAEQYITSLLESGQSRPPRPNVAAFVRNLTKSLEKIQSSGVPAISERRETEDKIVLTITIPKG